MIYWIPGSAKPPARWRRLLRLAAGTAEAQVAFYSPYSDRSWACMNL